MADTDAPLSARVRDARQARRLSQQDLAADAGVSTRQVTRIEAGDYDVPDGRTSRAVHAVMTYLRLGDQPEPRTGPEPRYTVAEALTHASPLQLILEAARQLGNLKPHDLGRISTMRDLPDHVKAKPDHELTGARDDAQKGEGDTG